MSKETNQFLGRGYDVSPRSYVQPEISQSIHKRCCKAHVVIYVSNKNLRTAMTTINIYGAFPMCITHIISFNLFFFFFFFCLFAISWAAPAAFGGSQARGLIRAVAAGLRQSHSNAGSEPRLQPTPQLTATPDR